MRKSLLSANLDKVYNVLEGVVLHKVLAVGLFVAGLVHWAIILGFLNEKAPGFITFYFHSLAVLDIVAAFFLYFRFRTGYVLVFVIAFTQLFAHGYMLYLDTYLNYGSGISVYERLFDIAVSLVLIVFCFFNLKEHAAHNMSDYKTKKNVQCDK